MILTVSLTSTVSLTKTVSVCRAACRSISRTAVAVWVNIGSPKMLPPPLRRQSWSKILPCPNTQTARVVMCV